MIAINFTKLFSIKIINESYRDKDEILRQLSIVPDKETEQKMKGCYLVNKIMSNRLNCFVQTKMQLDDSTGDVKIIPINEPFINIVENTVLSFNIILNSAYFINSSNVKTFYNRNKTFLFSNDTNNVQFRLTKGEFVALADQVNSDEKIFAQIKISLDKNLPNGFSVLDASNQIAAKDYTIQFKSSS